VLLPVIVSQVLHGGPHTLGFLTAASGLGALAGALYLASRRTVLGLGRVVGVTSITFGLALIAFSRSQSLALSLLLMPFIGASMIVAMASSNTILQTIVDEDMRARVMSFFAMSFFGTAPLGSLFSGVLANRIGAQNTILVGGGVCLIAALGFYRRLPQLRTLARPVYVRRGIIPDGPGEGAARSDGESA
jgi:MFS family permease